VDGMLIKDYFSKIYFVKEMENSKWFVHESCKVKKAILIKLVCKAKNAADRIS
jgi:hypothetical protein